MERKYRNYTDQDIIDNAKKVKSIAGLLKSLDLKPVGGNYINIKKHLQRLNVVTRHWTGQGWNKGQQLKDWKDYTRATKLKPHLIKERGNICSNCNNSEWLGTPIPLEVHHSDKDRTNNVKDNLILLCPNCHHMTKGFRNRKEKDLKNKHKAKKEKKTYKRKKTKKCLDCDSLILPRSIRCSSCYELTKKTKINWPAIEELLDRLSKTSYLQLGRELGVSDNAIRKHIKRHRKDLTKCQELTQQ